MRKKKEDNYQDDYENVPGEIFGGEIVEKKPPNDKILYYRIAEKIKDKLNDK